MNPEWRKDIVRNFALSVWGFVTLVLFFVVALLVNEMIENGQDPLDSLRNPTPDSTNESRTAARSTTALGEREIQLYFAGENGQHLQPVLATFEARDSTVENCKSALELLAKGPSGGAGVPVLPPGVRTRAVYLLSNGELVIDFSRELMTELSRRKSASIESLMVQGVLHTLTQRALQTKGESAVRRIRFLIEGSTPPDNFPAHLDLSNPLEPDSSWIGPAAPLAQAGGDA